MLYKLLEVVSSDCKLNDTMLFNVIKNLIELKLPHDEEAYIYKIYVELSLKLSSENSSVTKLRRDIWKNNFGVPSLEFILINQKQINELISIIKNNDPIDNLEEATRLGLKKYTTEIERNNNIDLYENYNKPDADTSGSFIATFNKQGFMTTKAVDSFSVQFIDKAAESSKTGGRVLEIGAAYGVATLVALDKGATVVCNDIEPAHLAVVVKEHMKMKRGNLIPVAASFPDELIFKDNEFDAILISRVLHFFDGDQIVNALNKARQWLKVGGSLFVVNETPYLSNWNSFRDEYDKRKNRGEKWPGLITNTTQYEQNRSLSLPPLVHWLDHDTLKKALFDAGFSEDEIQISYINREGQFPPDMLMKDEQKESVGCKATKLG